MNDSAPPLHRTTSDPRPATPLRGPLRLLLGGAAVLLHVFALWLVSVSGLLAPLWAILALGAAWLTACLPLARGLRRRALWVPLVPLAVLALWVAAMTLGDVLLGWTA